jgi:hypothetical protein
VVGLAIRLVARLVASIVGVIGYTGVLRAVLILLIA